MVPNREIGWKNVNIVFQNYFHFSQNLLPIESFKIPMIFWNVPNYNSEFALILFMSVCSENIAFDIYNWKLGDMIWWKWIYTIPNLELWPLTSFGGNKWRLKIHKFTSLLFIQCSWNMVCKTSEWILINAYFNIWPLRSLKVNKWRCQKLTNKPPQDFPLNLFET